MFTPFVEKLANVGLLRWARVMVETPFGHDLDSARELNIRLCAVLDGEQILRLDYIVM